MISKLTSIAPTHQETQVESDPLPSEPEPSRAKVSQENLLGVSAQKSASTVPPVQPTAAVADESSPVTLTERQLHLLLDQKIREAMASSHSDNVQRGRPYPVQYPKSPQYKVFDGTVNPKQHLAQFRASCCNAGGNDALLLRQFVSSLRA